MSLSQCDSCYPVTAYYHCSAYTLQVAADLTANSNYFAFVKDCHGTSYVMGATTNNSGDLSLTFTDARTFTAFSGKFEVSISTSANDNTGEILTIGSQTYTCMIVTFEQAHWPS